MLLRPHTLLRRLRLLCLLPLWTALTGCFSERSFAIEPGDFTPTPQLAAAYHGGPSTVDWLEHAHSQLARQLPGDGRRVLLTRAMRDADGRPVNVRRLFGLPSQLGSLMNNGRAIEQSAQVTGSTREPEADNPDWPDFEDVWIPIDDTVQLAGRLGIATDSFGRPRRSDCVIVLPGLLGDNSLWRTRDICLALRAAGLHALALEPRGFGQTALRYPAAGYTYGLRDVGDLLTAAEWLQTQPHVRETGLIGFSWSANIVLLAAWEDGRLDGDADVTPRLRAYQRGRRPGVHFRAGVLAFSPVLRFEELLKDLTRTWTLWRHPVLNRLQAGVRERGDRVAAPPSGDLKQLVEWEARRAGIDFDASFEDGYRYLRFLPYGGRPVGNKLNRVRVPVLLIQAANDPLDSAQSVVDMMAQVDNANVAALVLPSGGHNGFVAYARAYYYNLILHFFGAGRTAGAPTVVARPLH